MRRKFTMYLFYFSALPNVQPGYRLHLASYYMGSEGSFLSIRLIEE